MNKNIRMKLFVVMIVFSVTLSTIISVSDFLRLRSQAIENNKFQIEQIEDTIKKSLTNIEKAYHFFDEDTALRMERYTEDLMLLYEENPNFHTWDFDELKKLMDMDLYIINEHNVVTHSSFKDDIGLDFTKCCAKLSDILDTRRVSGSFYHDGIDIEQQTGVIKKYSYQATPDRKYIIQLGYNLQNGPIFNEFNFLSETNNLVEEYPIVNEINVLNIGGLSFGTSVEDRRLSENLRRAFDDTLISGKTNEIKGYWNGEPAKYRYVQYVSEYDEGSTKNKVLEIIYDDHNFQTILYEQRMNFFLQLLATLIIAVIVSLILSKLISRPMHLAFHDSLTGLRNRAAFDEYMSVGLSDKQNTAAFMMIDLDNFKLVNDHLGHDEGDYLLQQIAHSIRMVAGKDDMTFRYGGDEFIVVIENTSEKEVEKVAHLLIKSIKNVILNKKDLEGIGVSASIGIAFSPRHGTDLQVLYKKADTALYASKARGKNQYQVFSEELVGQKDSLK